MRLATGLRLCKTVAPRRVVCLPTTQFATAKRMPNTNWYVHAWVLFRGPAVSFSPPLHLLLGDLCQVSETSFSVHACRLPNRAFRWRAKMADARTSGSESLLRAKARSVLRGFFFFKRHERSPRQMDSALIICTSCKNTHTHTKTPFGKFVKSQVFSGQEGRCLAAC